MYSATDWVVNVNQTDIWANAVGGTDRHYLDLLPPTPEGLSYYWLAWQQMKWDDGPVYNLNVEILFGTARVDANGIPTTSRIRGRDA